jgi:hypothetical protein
MSLEDLHRDLFEVLARKVHFTDVIAMLRVSRSVRSKLLSCTGAWSTISFALLPVSRSGATEFVSLSGSSVGEAEEWNVNDALLKMSAFLTGAGLNVHVRCVNYFASFCLAHLIEFSC